MRAVAVMAVVLVHVAVASGAVGPSILGRLLAHLNIGVTIFFLISGFLLYRPFIAHRGGGAPAPKTSQYAKRRLLRIYPAYWLALTVLVVVPGQTGIVDGDWLRQYSLLHALPIGGDTTCLTAPLDCDLAHTWSLAAEVTFYAALPLYVLISGLLARGRGRGGWMRLDLLLLAGLAAASVIVQFAVIDGAPKPWVGASVIVFMFWFALGMALAVVSVGLEQRDHPPKVIALIAARPLYPWLLAFAGYALLTAYLPAAPFLVAKGDLLVAHVGFGLIALLLMLPAVFGDGSGGLPRRLLATPLVSWLGLVSYGIFLWHYAIAFWLGSGDLDNGFWVVLAGTLALTIPIAATSYYLIERPILRLKYRSLRDIVGKRNRRAARPSA